MGVQFDDLHRGGWDPEARLADQDRDGVAAEIIYPTVGMQLCNHRDADYKKACFDAYNRWIAEYCGGPSDPAARRAARRRCAHRRRRSHDLHAIKALGLRGVMMPGEPGCVDEHDYDSPAFDPFWEAAIELGLPLSFHILTTRAERTRGPTINSFLSVVRGCQDIMGMLVFGGVFERHPDLRVVCVEADAGLGPALHVPDGPRLQAPPLLAAARPGAVAAAVGVLRRGHLRHVPGRLDRVPARRRHELAPAHVGQRLPALRLHVAVVAGDAGRAHRTARPTSSAAPSSPATWPTSTASTRRS